MLTLKLLSRRQSELLARAQSLYASSLTLAAGFLNARGITLEVAAKWGIGVVQSPVLSHERFAGRLVVPYWNRAGVVALKFRCLEPHTCTDHPKYDQPTGQQHRLFNVLALEEPSRTIHVTEGELDAVVLSELLSEPVVGVPSATSWQPHWPYHFHDFDRIVVWADGDQAGRKMGASWANKVSAEVVELPDGHDVNSHYVANGANSVRQLYREES
jgi:hypothetical protein